MKHFKLILLYILLLSGVSFFNPMGAIDAVQSKVVFYVISLFCIIITIFCGERNRSKYPRFSYGVLLFSIAFTPFVASEFHDQSLQTSIIATLYYVLPFSALYILFKFNISSTKVERMLFHMAFLGMLVWIINIISFPNCMFGNISDSINDSRGMFRIIMPFIELGVLLVFYYINQWLVNKKIKYLIFAVIPYLFIVFSLTRQYIFLTTVLAILFILKNSSLKKKIGVLLLIVGFVYFILPQIPIYNNLVELTQGQIKANKYDEDVRIKAWKYYTYENQTNNITLVVGNGVPSFKSNWGSEFEYETSSNGCDAVDVGWAGFYWYFGLFATISLITLFIKAIIKFKRVDKEYLSYWVAFIIFTSILSGPILYSHQILSIMFVLYLIYNKDYEYNCSSYIKLQ